MRSSHAGSRWQLLPRYRGGITRRRQVAGSLSGGEQQMLAIGRALVTNPKVMLLDEPTQGMGHEDVDQVTALIRKVSEGRTVLMVEHNMNVVSTIADTISVLQHGRIIADGSYAEVSQNPLVKQAYMGSTV